MTVFVQNPLNKCYPETVYKTGERRIAEGKKNYLADEGALHKAEHILYSELSVVLGIDYSAVAEYIKNNM